MAIILEPVSFMGLDLGETQARVIQLNHATDIPTLVAAGSIALGARLFSDESKEIEQLVADKIKQLVSEVGIVSENVVFALPESEVFTRIIELPKMAKEEVAQAIHFEAESYIPYSLDEVQLDWQILEEGYQKDVDKMHALLVAAPLSIIDRMVSIVEKAQLRPLAIETNCVACNRALTNESPEHECIAIADIGSTSTELCISERGVIRLTHNIPIGGDHLTQAIAKDLNIEEAEAQKLKHGLAKLEDVQKELVTKAYVDSLEAIATEIKRSIDFYQSQPHSSQVGELILCGQGANLDGLEQAFKPALTTKISKGNPWEHIQSHDTLSDKQMERMASSFSVAIGLAMRREK